VNSYQFFAFGHSIFPPCLEKCEQTEFGWKIYLRNPRRNIRFGRKSGRKSAGGEVILLSGGLGAGKTLFTKGVLNALDFDIDEVTSPSFTLVNLYKTEKFDVYHIDFWRLDKNSDVAFAVGLDEILEDETAVVIIEWSERLKKIAFLIIIRVEITGDGEDARRITISI
jgi:tRNA threonylcarbamoyladenosine biosynthesis protein TsaE